MIFWYSRSGRRRNNTKKIKREPSPSEESEKALPLPLSPISNKNDKKPQKRKNASKIDNSNDKLKLIPNITLFKPTTSKLQQYSCFVLCLGAASGPRGTKTLSNGFFSNSTGRFQTNHWKNHDQLLRKLSTGSVFEITVRGGNLKPANQYDNKGTTPYLFNEPTITKVTHENQEKSWKKVKGIYANFMAINSIVNGEINVGTSVDLMAKVIHIVPKTASNGNDYEQVTMGDETGIITWNRWNCHENIYHGEIICLLGAKITVFGDMINPKYAISYPLQLPQQLIQIFFKEKLQQLENLEFDNLVNKNDYTTNISIHKFLQKQGFFQKQQMDLDIYECITIEAKLIAIQNVTDLTFATQEKTIYKICGLFEDLKRASQTTFTIWGNNANVILNTNVDPSDWDKLDEHEQQQIIDNTENTYWTLFIKSYYKDNKFKSSVRLIEPFE